MRIRLPRVGSSTLRRYWSFLRAVVVPEFTARFALAEITGVTQRIGPGEIELPGAPDEEEPN